MGKVLSFIQQRPAQILALTNTVFGVLLTFNVVLTQTQMGAIILFVNAAIGLITPPSIAKATIAKIRG